MGQENLPEEDKPKKRKYKKRNFLRKSTRMSDAKLLQNSRTWLKLFSDHLAEFTAKDPDLDAGFAADWLLKIEQMESHDSDETLRDAVEEKSELLVLKTKALLAVIDDLEYYVKRAFPDDERILQEYQFEDFRKPVAKYHSVLIVITFVVTKLTLDDYWTELTAAGLPLNWEETVQTALDGMGTTERDQEYRKRLRIRGATIRIRKFNELWAIHQRIKAAAALVFRENPVVAKQFE